MRFLQNWHFATTDESFFELAAPSIVVSARREQLHEHDDPSSREDAGSEDGRIDDDEAGSEDSWQWDSDEVSV